MNALKETDNSLKIEAGVSLEKVVEFGASERAAIEANKNLIY